MKSKYQVKRENESKVLIRIYGNWHDEEEQTDSLITLLLGERNLGPKLLGVFPGGRIEEFIEVKNFGFKLYILKNFFSHQQ